MITDRFDAEEVWRTVERERVNSLSVTGDAMARPLADALETLDDELDLSCVVSFSSTAAIFSQTVKEQLQRLLPDYVVMTDAIGSTESGMNGIRIVQKGDAPKEGITSVQASADSVVLDDDFEPIEPGSGKVGRVARGGNIPLGYYNDPVKTAEVFVTDAQGKRWSIPGDYATVEADGRITLLGRGSVSINSGGEKVYPEEVEGALKSHPDVFDVLVVGVPDERWGERVTALLQPRARPRADARRRSRRTAARTIAGYKVPRALFLVDEVPRLPNGKPDYRTARSHCEHARGPSPASTRLASRRNPTHGELGGTGLRGWTVAPSPCRTSAAHGRPATDPSNLLRVMPAEGGTCTAARWCWPAAIRFPRRCATRCPPPTSSSRPTPASISRAALGLHVDRIVGDLDSADRGCGRRRRRGGRRGRTAPGREGCDRPRARDRRGRARRRDAHRRRRRWRWSPRPPPRQLAAARVARAGPTIEIEARFGRPCHRRARRPRRRRIEAGTPGSLVTLAPGRRRGARHRHRRPRVPARARRPRARARRAA